MFAAILVRLSCPRGKSCDYTLPSSVAFLYERRYLGFLDVLTFFSAHSMGRAGLRFGVMELCLEEKCIQMTIAFLSGEL